MKADSCCLRLYYSSNKRTRAGQVGIFKEFVSAYILDNTLGFSLEKWMHIAAECVSSKEGGFQLAVF